MPGAEAVVARSRKTRKGTPRIPHRAFTPDRDARGALERAAADG